MSIITVQGPITESKLGVTLSHEHLLCDLWKVVKNYSAILDDEELAVAELLHYKSLGGNSVVDATSVGLGRNPLALQRIAKACGLNVIMGSGWYRECTYPPYVLEMDANSLADIIVKDITVGADGTGVRAGMVGEIGTERYHISPAQERVFRASARAQRRTGVSIWTHTTHFGELALDQIALLREEGVPSDRIVISHLGDQHNCKVVSKVAGESVYLSVDNIGYRGEGYGEDEWRARNIAQLVAEGHLHQIMLSGDICLKQHLRAYGGKGYGHVLGEFVPLLRTQGLTEEQIVTMTVTNPARALAVAP
jgi:phosphotriesterase-related protein